MKKSLVALAVLAAAGAASAQSSVTLFGIVDAGVTYTQVRSTVTVTGPGISTSATAKSSLWAMTNSGLSSSRLGFRGTEDLGGGLAASFWLEAGVNNDSGAGAATNAANATPATASIAGGAQGLTFNRRSTVSLSGGFGEIRLGRDYTPTFSNDSAFDPFGTNGLGTNQILNSHPANGMVVRASNSIGYFLPPNIGGVYGQVMYAFHENAKIDGVAGSPSAAGRYIGARVGYANGPLDLALAYGQATTADTLVADTRVRPLNFGLSYDLGVVKLFTELSRVNLESQTGGITTADIDTDGFLVGVTAPVGAGLIRAAYSQTRAKDGLPATIDPRNRKFALGYVHNLSKRTALYSTYAYTNGKTGLIVGALRTETKLKGHGVEAGLRHSF